MDLAVLNELQAQKAYKSSEEFLTDVGWIVHNMSIYPDNMGLLKHARALQKRAKQEVEEMEPCYECYIKANTLCEDWFREPCSKPHLLVWAKMKGYPYWPAKLYVINSNNQAFVRFFGAHDRTWMPVKECYLFSQREPNPPKQNLKSKLVQQYASSLEDIKHHIDRLREQFNTFNYGSFMEAVDPSRFEEQQRAMLPGAFLKKVKVTIKRSEGEMVAVASAASDEAAQVLLAKPEVSVVEEEKDATLASTPPAKKVAVSSPRKRMTRRMSRFMKTADELTSSLMSTEEGSQDLMAPSTISLLSSNDKTGEKQQTSDVPPAESMGERLDDVDCNPKNLSLLLRRGSQSWETEPLSKRRKSVAEKGTLVSAAPKPTRSSTATTGSKVKATLQKETAEEPVAAKAIVPQNVLIEKAILVSVAPTKTKPTGPAGSKTNVATIQREAVEPVAEQQQQQQQQAIMPPNVMIDKTILVSVVPPPTKTKSTATTLRVKETARAATAKDGVEPAVERVPLVSSNAVDPTQPAVNNITNTAVAETENVVQHSLKQATIEAQPTHTLTTVAKSAEVVSIPVVVVTATNTTKLCVNPLESVVVSRQLSTTNATTVCTTVAASNSDTASNGTGGTSTAKPITTTIAVTAIKNEICSDDETNIVESSKVVLPVVTTKEPVRNNNSASLTQPAPPPSASTDAIKRQHITSPVSSAIVVKSVQQTLPEVLPISSSSTITM
uniref:PWWP domain-containing protein n=1 Tax=Anopheles maculatus TaxID=74869 RepID=A0A182TAV8_9DIPT